ncbi:DHH family phosphoesterase [Coriobacteriia bacterium Es71-Z0120]|uniref:DHH family phosphoesterase n=1 Tax=Parvivirga hydrogeniphila TaxID=2939460 RepID=UPI002260CC63|nr:DHH family phosphoesterase [Parvivirga hydrogeniphila]MCL4079602.1 DHH family phosphoesterase [Parvivirga hydrogeniphila]
MTSEVSALEAVAHAVRRSQRIAVCSHVDPDGDAVGSVLALAHALERAGHAVDRVLASGERAPVTYAFLEGAALFVRASALDRRPDLIFALDAPNPGRLGEAAALLENATLVVIDHHPDNARYGTVNLVDAEAPSTSALIWEVLKHLAVEPDHAMLDCIFCGLMTDTGRFSYANATPRAFLLAAELAQAGARTSWVYSNVYERRSHAALKLQARTMDRLTFVKGGAVAYSWITDDDLHETGALPEETEDLIDSVRVVDGPDVVALFKCSPGRVKGSLRAKGGADVGAVARALGGGGHRAAAGFTLTGTLSDALAAVLPLLPARS